MYYKCVITPEMCSMLPRPTTCDSGLWPSASVQRDNPQRPPGHVQGHPRGLRLRGLLRVQRLPIALLRAGGLQLHPQHHLCLALLHHQQGHEGEWSVGCPVSPWLDLSRQSSPQLRLSAPPPPPTRSKCGLTAPEVVTTTRSRSWLPRRVAATCAASPATDLPSDAQAERVRTQKLHQSISNFLFRLNFICLGKPVTSVKGDGSVLYSAF